MHDVGESAVIFAVHVLGEVNLPTQSVINCEFWSDAPRVLRVIEHSMLTFRRVDAGADVAAKVRHIPKHERSEIQSATAATRSSRTAERINTSTIGIARHTQVLGVTDVSTKLKLMVAFHLGYVTHELVLALFFDQRAVATRNAQPVSEIRQVAGGVGSAPIVHIEFAQARREVVSHVRVWNAEVAHCCDTGVRLVRHRVVLEESKPEVAQQARAERLGRTHRQTVVVNVRAAGQSAWTEAHAANRTQAGRAGEREAVQAEAAEQAESLAGREIDSSVKAILVVRTGSGSDEVVQAAQHAATELAGAGCSRTGKGGQHLQSGR